VPELLPRLRLNLDFLPSTEVEKPGLYIRDPYRYSETSLLIPPPLVAALECFDGQQTALELRAELVRITGEIHVETLEQDIFSALNDAGFLETDRYRELKTKREAAFGAESIRMAEFAGSAYPSDREKLGSLLQRRVGSPAGKPATVGIAAPHASPDGGWETYRAAYSALPSGDYMADRTFVILGTSHYGAPDHFGLTRKRFSTPFGTAESATGLVDELAAAAAGCVRMEDYCHAVEHSIEFQIVFLQHLFGPRIKVLPILCGPFVRSIYDGTLPEENEHVARFLGTLGEISAREGDGLFWVLGVDMAHIGQRYGDPLRASANIGEMLAIKDRDRERIDRINAGGVSDYWSLVQQDHDDLKWCGASPFYTFLRANPDVRGELLNYQQWQIDPASVVSFGALSFARKN
jgi:AmmeMemoRadiSam system protein B